MDIKEVQIRKNKKITDTLREMNVGETVFIKGSRDSARQIACRLKKEGMRFATSTKGINNGINIERIE